jgi:hypothetical protein
MLGIDERELPEIKGRYASNALKAINRVHSGKMSGADRKTAARSAKILNEFTVIKK